MQEPVEALRDFFERDVCQKATSPLKDGIQISLQVDGKDATLEKVGGRASVEGIKAQKPDMTFTVPAKAVAELTAQRTEDIGEIGITIIKLMAHEDEGLKIRAKVHIGPFQLLRNGYFGVLPLGGGTVMKFLASKGFGNVGKIKDAISKMRG